MAHEGQPSLIPPMKGTWPILTSLLFVTPILGVSVAQAVYYFRQYPQDKRWLKVMAAGVLLADLLHFALICDTLWYYHIFCKVYENRNGYLKIRWSIAAACILTDGIALTFQFFYTWRLWHISSRFPLRPRQIFVSIIVILSIASACINIGAIVIMLRNGKMHLLHMPIPRALFSSSLALTTSCDSILTCAMVLFLVRSRTGLKRTENVLNRLIFLAIGAGTLTSITAVATLVMYMVSTQNIDFMFPYTLVSKFYVNSFFVALNSRTAVRRELMGTFANMDVSNWPVSHPSAHPASSIPLEEIRSHQDPHTC